MPRTVVPEEQKRAADVTALKSIYPSDNRVVHVLSDPNSESNFYYWDPTEDAANADGVQIVESNITEFADGGANEGAWKKGRRDVSVLDSLVPNGEDLTQVDGTNGTSGKLSAADGSFTKNQLFDTTDENGVVGPTSVSLNGDLNPQVSSTDNYDADSFDNATEGTLKLVVNGSDLVTIDLSSTTNSITNTTANGSELSVSAASPLTFANGDTYSDIQQRTGSWTLDQGDMVSGVNDVKVRHEDGTGTLISETNLLQYFLDDDTNDITFANESLSGLSTSGTKDLSGITYNTGGSASYSIDVNNAYLNTYEEGTDAITFSTTNVSVGSIAIPELGGTEDSTTTVNLSETATISANRIVSGSATVSTNIEDPVDTNAPFTSAGSTNFDLLVDQVSNSNGALLHEYDDESYRLAPSQNYDTDLGTGAYDSTQSLADGNTPYDTQLQVTEGQIVYPSTDYSVIADGPTNPNYSGTNTTGQRTYYGVFTDTQAVSNFVLFINGTATLVSEGTVSSGTDEMSVAIKAPSQTGWMDVNENFTSGSTGDGAGAYQETNATNPSQTIGTNSEIGVTIGTNSTADSFDNLYYRLTAPADWTGNITQFDIDWGADN